MTHSITPLPADPTPEPDTGYRDEDHWTCTECGEVWTCHELQQMALDDAMECGGRG